MHWALNAGLSFLSGVAGGLLAIGFCLWLAGVGDPWIGFAGSIVSGAMTLVAAVYAFGLTRRQVDMQAKQLRGMQVELARRYVSTRNLVYRAAQELKKYSGVIRLKLIGLDEEFLLISDIEAISVPEIFGINNETWRLNVDLMIAFEGVKTAVYAYNHLKVAFFDLEKIPVSIVVNCLDAIDRTCVDLMMTASKDEIPNDF